MMKQGIECSQVVVEKAAKAIRGNNEKAQNGRERETVVHGYVMIRSFLRETYLSRFIIIFFIFNSLCAFVNLEIMAFHIYLSVIWQRLMQSGTRFISCIQQHSQTTFEQKGTKIDNDITPNLKTTTLGSVRSHCEPHQIHYLYYVLAILCTIYYILYYSNNTHQHYQYNILYQ